MATELADLVMAGSKRVTASLAPDYGEGYESIPKPGDIVMMLYPPEVRLTHQKGCVGAGSRRILRFPRQHSAVRGHVRPYRAQENLPDRCQNRAQDQVARRTRLWETVDLTWPLSVTWACQTARAVRASDR